MFGLVDDLQADQRHGRGPWSDASGTLMNAGSRTMGFRDEAGVYIADDQASGEGVNKAVLKTALEECLDLDHEGRRQLPRLAGLRLPHDRGDSRRSSPAAD